MRNTPCTAAPPTCSLRRHVLLLLLQAVVAKRDDADSPGWWRRIEHLRSLRRRHVDFSDIYFIGPRLKWAFANQGNGRFANVPVSRERPRPFFERRFNRDQVGNAEIYERLRRGGTVGTRPVWQKELVDAMSAMVAAGKPIAPMAYPHAGEDLVAAARLLPAASRRFAVWSSISPWAELLLLHHASASRVVTVDYNPPVLRNVSVPLTSMTPSEVFEHVARRPASRYDAIVAFSGVEHDGLGRYGDPLDPDGDFAAVEEMRLCLKPGGILLLAVPVTAEDDVTWPKHRLYGPVRLPRLLARFNLIGRVWNGTTVLGGLENAAVEPTLWVQRRPARGVDKKARLLGWQHQPVLVLQRREYAEQHEYDAVL